MALYEFQLNLKMSRASCDPWANINWCNICVIDNQKGKTERIMQKTINDIYDPKA